MENEQNNKELYEFIADLKKEEGRIYRHPKQNPIL